MGWNFLDNTVEHFVELPLLSGENRVFKPCKWEMSVSPHLLPIVTSLTHFWRKREMKRLTVLLGAFVLIVLSNNSYGSTIIAEVHFYGSSTFGGNGGLLSTTAMDFWWGTPGVDNYGVIQTNVMSWGHFTESDIGKMFSLTAIDSPYFNHYVNLLTSNIDDRFTQGFSFVPKPAGISSTSNESQFLNKYISNNSPDLCGYNISEINIIINDLSITFGPNIYDVNAVYDVTWQIIPEPNSILLLSLGIIVLRKRV